MDAFGKLAFLAVAGAGGYFGWRYYQQRKLEEQAKAIALATGVPAKDILAALGSAACKAYLKSQTGGVGGGSLGNSACDVAGKLASIVIMKGGKVAIKGTVAGAKAIGSGVVTGGKAVGNVIVGGGKAAVNVVSKLKFWGLEGLSC